MKKSTALIAAIFSTAITAGDAAQAAECSGGRKAKLLSYVFGFCDEMPMPKSGAHYQIEKAQPVVVLPQSAPTQTPEVKTPAMTMSVSGSGERRKLDVPEKSGSAIPITPLGDISSRFE